MGTKFRTLLAPIGVSTGDGRRFKDGGISLADLPMPFEWARSREGGHDGAVSVGAVQEAKVMTVKAAVADGWISADAAKGLDQNMSAVFGRGELFDGVDREEMPRLAEDVAEAMHLIGAGTLGPSVDLDSFQAIPVMEGSDDELTWDDIEAHIEEHGEEPNIELLITEGRVRAATLVSIPAFAETSRPLELEAETGDTEDTDADPAKAAADLHALVASVSGGRALPSVGAFALPVLDGPTPITWDWDGGRVFGHVATWATCHVGYADVCVTAPKVGDEPSGYSSFNRYALDTEDGGTIWTGRLTVGGRHAGLALTANAAMSVYDSKTVAADVVAYEDEHGIVVAGVIRPDLDGASVAALNRRKVSGDWRETPAGLSLIEVLALSPGPRAHSEPGFPVETFSRGGRQVALTASLGPVPGEGLLTLAARPVDVRSIVRAARAEEKELAAAEVARAELAATVEGDEAARAALARAELATLVQEG